MLLGDIHTARLTLTPITRKFTDSACAYATNPENARMMVFLPARDRAEVEEFIDRAVFERQKPLPESVEYAVLFEGEHVGGFSVYFEGHPVRGELGWIMRKDCWGKGFAVEAARGVMDYFKSVHGLSRFIAQCDSENAASQRVMEKLGMSFVEAHGGRFNRLAPNEERTELLYEIYV